MASHLQSTEQRILRELLRATRENSGLNQVALAKKLGKPQSYISKYESGERRLDLPEIRQVCAATGVSLATFVKRYEKLLSD